MIGCIVRAIEVTTLSPAPSTLARVRVRRCDEGAVDIAVIMDGPHSRRASLMTMFLALSSGKHVFQSDTIQVYKATEMLLVPQCPVFNVNMSGERDLPVAPVYHMSVVPRMVLFDQC
jgi:hypothetical protein